MKIKNSKNWSTVPRMHAYAAAFLITMAAFGASSLLHLYLKPHVSYQLFFIACLLAEYWLGLGPAILSVVLGLSLRMLYFIPPYGVYDGISRSDLVVIFNFVLTTVFSIALLEYLKRTLYANQLLLKILQSRHKISLYRENDRLYLDKKSTADTRALERFFSGLPRVLLIRHPNRTVHPQLPLYQRCTDLPLSGQHGEQGWKAAIHPDDALLLEKEMAALEQSQAAQVPLDIRLRSHENAYVQIDAILQRIAIGKSSVIALSLKDDA